MSHREPAPVHSYGEDSPFVRLLETPGRVRILDVFLRKFNSELSASDISHLVSESTFSRNKDVLLELGIIKPARLEAGKQYYQLNRDSDLVELLGQFHTQLIAHSDAIQEGTDSMEGDYIGRIMMTKAAQMKGSSQAPKGSKGSKSAQEMLASISNYKGEPDS